MKSKMLALALGAAVLAAGTAQAAPIILTFEEPILVAMGNNPGALVPIASRLTDQFLATVGVEFTSGGGFVAVIDHGFPLLTPTPPNIIGGTNPDGTLNYSAEITASFFDPFNTAVQATTNHVRVLGELYGLGSGTVTLTAYDRFGGVLGTVSDVDNYPLGTGPVLEINAAGIQSVRFSGTSGTVAFDNFEFNGVTAVPEPATWAFMIGGFGLLGSTLRRRRALAAA